jgi:DNA/RNA-binding domain of Phe-tRNA-synthetase-like protein
MGAYDISRLPQPSVELRFARPESDRFQPVGGDPSKYPLKTGMPVYASASEIVCYGFNHRDSTVTACHQTSDQILFVSEIVDDDMLIGLKNALTELRAILAVLGMKTSEINAVVRHEEASISAANPNGEDDECS